MSSKSSLHEKSEPGSPPAEDPEEQIVEGVIEDNEVFKKTTEGVDFRTVSWPRATVIFLKVIFATGVLTIPTALLTLGAVGGALSVVAWTGFNTYSAKLQGDFRNRHAKCHSIVDMAALVGGTVVKEITGVLFIISYILCAGSGIVGVSTALNALSHHATCTVWFTFVGAIVIGITASVRKFQQIGLLTYAGFVSIFVAVLIVVIGVTTRSRPAAAPQTGPYELGFYVISYPSFAAGMVASCNIFVSSASTSAFLPIISEMRNPRDYRKALYTCMAIVTSSYVAFSLVVYRWCGQWVASPSLGSAGQTVKMVAYGIALVGLVVSACLYIHIAAKYVFVRILRDTVHLQANTFVHWATWLGSVFSLVTISFILSEAIPVFNYLLALAGALCYAPIGIALPAWLWIYDHKSFRKGTASQKLAYWTHAFLIPLGMFVLVGGTYGIILEIKEAYASGLIGGAFSCADNSNSS